LIQSLNNRIVTQISDLNQNIGEVETRGLDLSTHYKFPSTSVGDFKLGLDWTFLKSYAQTKAGTCTLADVQYKPQTGCSAGNPLPTPIPPLPKAKKGKPVVAGNAGGPPYTSPDLGNPIFVTSELAGTTTGFGGFPKQRANASLNWNYGDWSASWNMEYIHGMYEGCTLSSEKLSLCSNPGPAFVPYLSATPIKGKKYPADFPLAKNYLGATIYHDVQGTYHYDDWNTDFTFGIRNLFDKEPPTALTAFANSFLPAFYRVPGREFYGRISVKF